MTALTEDTGRRFVQVQNGGTIIDVGLLAAAVIFRGSAVSVDAAGFGIALTANPATLFLGIATEAETGSAVNGEVTCKVQHAGVVKLTVAAATIADVGDGVYATDDGTFNLTALNNTSIGRLIHVTPDGAGWVQLKVVGAVSDDAATPG